MKEHPILFNTPMAQAILAGRKTQTRRIFGDGFWFKGRNQGGKRRIYSGRDFDLRDAPGEAPWKAGDLLWVRETFAVGGRGETHYYVYRADDEEQINLSIDGKWKPSIFMPRSASRITLRVKKIRVERVQDISEEDAKAEGIRHFMDLVKSQGLGYGVDKPTHPIPMQAFKWLWDSMNAKRGFGWQTNPLVWVIEFEKAEGKK